MKKTSHAKMQQQHAFSQFELSKFVLNNLSQYDVTPTAKLVLLYLTNCYNPSNADVFPKQSTIAAVLGVSERSVVRAVAELCGLGLIIIECKNSNRYKFTSAICENFGAKKIEKPATKKDKKSDEIRLENVQIDSVESLAQSDFLHTDNLADECGQNVGLQSDKMSGPYIEQKKEKKMNISDEEFKVLVEFAKQRGAKNAQLYAQALIRNGAAAEILHKTGAARRQIEATNKLLEQQRENARNCKKPAEFTFDEAADFVQKTHPKMRKLSLTCKMLVAKFPQLAAVC